jgi:putative SOS response-associated peptidase YedK
MAVQAAAASLGIAGSSVSSSAPESSSVTAAAVDRTSSHQNDETTPTSSSTEWRDNYNMSPGMDALVFWKDGKHIIRVDQKVWGLVPRAGTKQSPLPIGMNQHFSNLMFNARSDTLYIKPTFARLASVGKTCLVALDGFFEWKGAAGKASKKQPYFVHRKTESKDNKEQRPYLLMAGLWTSVATGRPDDPTLDTFTILTTDACESLQWLHTRMPVFVWDEKLAMEWLNRPTQKLHRQLDEAAMSTGPDMLAWHAVTTDMSSTKFRKSESMAPMKPMKTVKSFFGVAKKKDPPKSDPKIELRSKTTASPEKRTASTRTQSPPSKKSKQPTPPKKGAIDSFFLPKSSTK